jgi:hypothetical protein
MVGGVLVTVAAVVVALVVSFTTSGPTSGHGCIYATIPAATGAQYVSRCGAAARATCATVFAPGAFTPEAAPVIAAQCRKAGLRVGR